MEGAVAGPGWSVWPAPAKLNLFLHITGRRPDGYHALQTVFRLLDWGDRIHLRPRADGQVLRNGAGATAEPADDLAVRAAYLLRTAANISEGIDIVVEKAIPQGGGFGGGSSDAATVLVAANALWGLQLDVDDLAALGRQLGADVPVFVHGRNAWGEGVGDVLTPLDLPAAWYVLLDPAVHAATASLFQEAELTRHAAPATIADFVSGSLLDNVFEPVLRRREPAVEAAFRLMARIGRPRLTGSGSGCFVEFADRESAEAALATLPRGPRTWLAAGAKHSPLLDALNENRLQGRRQEAQGTRF